MRGGAVNSRDIWNWRNGPIGHKRRGGMTMSPRNTGLWWDDYLPSGKTKTRNSRRRDLRLAKRRERRIKMREALDA